MKVFLAGASGVVGHRLIPLLLREGHSVIGTTRSAEKAKVIVALDALPVVVDVFDAAALAQVVARAKPDVVIHQLTDLTAKPGTSGYVESLARNAQLRIDGTRNLVAAAKAAGVRRLVAQSIAFIYAKADGVRVEGDPLNSAAEMRRTIEGVEALERETLSMPEGIVLRYGFFYGSGTWFDEKRPPALLVDAAAQAAALALTRGKPGIYNIAEDDGVVSSEKAKRDLGFDALFRL